jgi:lysophospholipase L1-like esterase
MWEDFMRGNWPVAVSASPVTPTPHRAADAATTSAEPRAKASPGPRRVAVKAAVVAGAAMLLGSLVPTVAIADGSTATHGHTTSHVRSGLDGPLVALGDSYAAGNLIPRSPVGSPDGCLRSTHSYSAYVAKALHARYVDAACTGAKVADMTAPEPVLLGTDPPQLTALAANDAVVTLTIGGNDIGFAKILLVCAALSITRPWSDPCERHYTSGGTDQIAAAIRAQAPRIAALLLAIHARAPRARVLVVGYPDILPNTGHGCFPVVPFAYGDVPYLRHLEIGLNQMLATDAAAHGATFVDTYTATIGHDACSAAGIRDVEGLIPTSPAYPFHPNQRGQQVMADRVLAALRAR